MQHDKLEPQPGPPSHSPTYGNKHPQSDNVGRNPKSVGRGNVTHIRAPALISAEHVTSAKHTDAKSSAITWLRQDV